MSASQPPPSNPPGGTPPAADPSMDDILASIRRILNEEEPAPDAAEPPAPPPPPSSQTPQPPPANVLALSKDMLVADTPPARLPAPTPRDEPRAADARSMAAGAEPGPVKAAPTQAVREHLVAPDAAAAAASSVGTLLRTLMNEREQVHVYRGGPTVEDLVREEVRGLLKVWLDVNLPPLVERLVRSEIERVVGRAAS